MQKKKRINEQDMWGNAGNSHRLSETPVPTSMDMSAASIQEEDAVLSALPEEGTAPVFDKGTEMAEEQAAPPLSVGRIGQDEVRQAQQTLMEYKRGKANLEARIVENEQWWKMRHWEQIRGGKTPSDIEPTSAWLFNSIANRHADAMDNYPEPCVLPREAGDQQDARVLSSILPVILEQNHYEQVYSDVWWYKLKTGTGVKGVFWDTGKQGGLGDVTIKKADILCLFWEPGITDIQDSRNLFHVQLVDNDILEEQYPQLKDKLSTSSVEVAQYIYDDTVDTSEKSAVVDWYYKRWNGSRQVLHYAKFVNDEVLFASENDPAFMERGFYDHGLYPFVFDTLFVEEGTPAGFGYIDVMKDAQTYIDKLGQAIMKTALMTSKKRFFIRQDGSVNEEEFADWNKDLIHVNGNLGEDSIRELKPNPLSSINVQMMQLKIDELKETSGNRDFTQGGTTGGVTAASAIAALQEAGSKLSRDMLKSAYRAFTQECYLILELIRQFYDEPRQFRITGIMGQEEFVSYDNSRIRPYEEAMPFSEEMGSRVPVFDIKVRAQKANSFSRISQNELAKEFYGMGFFNPQIADQALACMEMMDFEGKDMVMQKVAQNGTMLQQLQQMQQQMMQMAAVIQQAGLMPSSPGAVGGQPAMSPVTTGDVPAGDDPMGRAVQSAQATHADTARQRAMGQTGAR